MHQSFDLSNRKEAIKDLRKNLIAKIESEKDFIEKSLKKDKRYRIFFQMRKFERLQCELEFKIELELFYYFSAIEAIEYIDSIEIAEKIYQILNLFKNSEKFYIALEFKEEDKIS